MGKTQQAYEWDKLMYSFVGEDCPAYVAEDGSENLQQVYSDYRESLCEINAMIEHCIVIGDVDEVASWRRFLMRTKMEMREIKQRMKRLGLSVV